MQITVQRDGRILFEEHCEENRFLDPSDPYALTTVMRSHTVFEDGLTLRQLMKAIRPWKEVFGSAGWMDFDAWFAEIDRTHLSQVMSEHNVESDPLASLEIYNIIHLDRPEEGHLEVHSYWDFHAYYQTPVETDGLVSETCSVSFVPARAYANLPITINYKAKVHHREADYLGGRRPVLNAQRPGVYSHIETRGSFFDIVVLGLLDPISFHGDPEDTEERGDELFETVASLRKSIEDEGTDDDHSEIDDDVTEGDTPADGMISMSMDEFWAEMGLSDVGNRYKAASELNDALKPVDKGDAVLAEKLDITLLGLAELKAGINAHMTIGALQRTTKIVIDHMNPSITTQELDLPLAAAFKSVWADPIQAVKGAVTGRYKFKSLVCFLILIGLVNLVLHCGFVVAGVTSRDHAWAYLGRGLIGSILAAVPVLSGATMAKLLQHQAGREP
jgi:hypothetical protein